MMYYLVTALYVFVCFILLMVILLQQGKGGDMASAFGGGSSQTAFGARGGATLLSKITAGFAVLFMLGALGLAIMGERGGGSSLMRGTPSPAPTTPTSPESSTTPAAPSAPATSAPATTAPGTPPAGETPKPPQ